MNHWPARILNIFACKIFRSLRIVDSCCSPKFKDVRDFDLALFVKSMIFVVGAANFHRSQKLFLFVACFKVGWEFRACPKP